MIKKKNNSKSDKNYNNSILKKIDWNIVIFIINHLHHNPNLKRTSLSMKTGLCYSRFMRYVNWLLLIEWIEIIDIDGWKILRLTPQGRIVVFKIQAKSKTITEHKNLSESIKAPKPVSQRFSS